MEPLIKCLIIAHSYVNSMCSILAAATLTMVIATLLDKTFELLKREVREYSYMGSDDRRTTGNSNHSNTHATPMLQYVNISV